MNSPRTHRAVYFMQPHEPPWQRHSFIDALARASPWAVFPKRRQAHGIITPPPANDGLNRAGHGGSILLRRFDLCSPPKKAPKKCTTSRLPLLPFSKGGGGFREPSFLGGLGFLTLAWGGDGKKWGKQGAWGVVC